MKIKILISLTALLGLLGGIVTAEPLGTAFTYQGKLTDGGNPANGNYDLRFTIYDSPGGPAVVAGPFSNTPTAVSNGLFMVTLDFGGAAFTGEARWLEIGVRTNGAEVDFTALTPRQALTPSPYAIYTTRAGTATSATNVVAGGVVNASLAADAVTGDKVLDGSLTAADVNAGSFSNTLWKVDGNVGTTPGTHFLGTTDNQALELKVNGQQALRLEPTANAPNVIAGDSRNVVSNSFVSATIGGGGGWDEGQERPNIANDDFVIVGGGAGNFAGFTPGVYPYTEIPLAEPGSAKYAAVGGGSQNTAQGRFSVVSGGADNGVYSDGASVLGGCRNKAGVHPLTEIVGDYLDNDGDGLVDESDENSVGMSVIASGLGYESVGGGVYNWARGSCSTVGGGYFNVAEGLYAAVGGGDHNCATNWAAVPGGSYNVASGEYSLAAGHRARAQHAGAFVWADASGEVFDSTAANQFLIRAAGGVGIGTNDPAGAALHVAGPVRAASVQAVSFHGDGSGLHTLDSGSLRLGPLTIQPTFASAGSMPRAGFGEALRIAVAGNCACLANGTDGLRVYDVSDPANPLPLAHANDGLYTRDVALRGAYAYLADADGLRIYDVSNPASPVCVGHPTNTASSVDVALAGDYACLADGLDGVRIYNVADPANPVNVSQVTFGAVFASGVAVAADHLFIACSGGGLRVYNITNPASPVFLAVAYDGGLAEDVAVDGRYAYLANHSDGLRIYDVSNPATPVNVGHADDSAAAEAVAIQGRYAYLADWTNGVHIYDISDVTHPVRVQELRDSPVTHSATPSGSRLFLAYGYDGVSVYSLSSAATAPAFQGDGRLLTSLNASNLTSGTVSAERIDEALARDSEIMPTVLAGDGEGSTLDADLLDGQHATAFAAASHEHSAADIVSDTLSDARLSGNVALLNASQIFSGGNSFTNAANNFSGDGSGLTSISASAIVGGLTTNLAVLVPGGWTNTLCFTNGILRAIQ